MMLKDDLMMLKNYMIPSAMVGGLDSYLSYIGNIPILTPDEEYSLAVSYHEKNDIEAAQKLILSHLRFVVYIAKGYINYGLPLTDLIQEGNIGLMEAVKRFDPTKDIRLVSFAVRWIKGGIYNYIGRNWRIVRTITTKAQRKLFYNLRKFKKGAASLTVAETEMIAKELRVKVSDVVEMEKRLWSKDVPIDPVTDSDEEHSYNPATYLEAEGADPVDILEAQNAESFRPKLVAEALKTLDDRSRDIVTQRHLSGKQVVLQVLAAKYDISAERVRQLEVLAISKLKEICNPQYA